MNSISSQSSPGLGPIGAAYARDCIAVAHAEGKLRGKQLRLSQKQQRASHNWHRLYRKGERHTSLKDQRCRAVYLFGAVCPSDTAFGHVMPIVSTDAMPIFLNQLNQLDEQAAPGAAAVVVINRPGWHSADDLVCTDNITPVFLPFYSLTRFIHEGDLAFGIGRARGWRSVRFFDLR